MSDDALPPGREPELVFAYGSLMFAEVCEAVIGRVPVWSTAHVEGWFVSSVPGALYPALVPKRDAVADGMLLEGISDQEIRTLDRYEGSGFDRVRVLTGPDDLEAWVWVARRPSMASGEPWDPAVLQSAMSEYLGR